MQILEAILHLDQYLEGIVAFFGPWSYLFFGLIIFAETGLVVFPFLPGDSLLFAIGALASQQLFDIWVLFAVLLAAAIVGDGVNYWIGHYLGPRVFNRENSKLFNKAYLEKTREFYHIHGGKTIIIARFLPIMRTFAPFVAGIGKMHYGTFLLYNVAGGFLWVTLFLFAGYFFGALPFVKENFEYMVLGIIAVSLLPLAVEYIKHKRGPRLTKKQMDYATYKDIRETLEEEELAD